MSAAIAAKPPSLTLKGKVGEGVVNHHPGNKLVVIPDLIRDPGVRDDRGLQFYVYMLAARKNGTLYVGVTNDLVRRVYEHRTGAAEGFTRRYDVKSLVYFEIHQDAAAAIAREKKLKRWRRAWKIALIERDNPDWRDLYQDIA